MKETPLYQLTDADIADAYFGKVYFLANINKFSFYLAEDQFDGFLESNWIILRVWSNSTEDPELDGFEYGYVELSNLNNIDSEDNEMVWEEKYELNHYKEEYQLSLSMAEKYLLLI